MATPNMEKAITDIVFVTSPDSKPLGYTIVSKLMDLGVHQVYM